MHRSGSVRPSILIRRELQASTEKESENLNKLAATSISDISTFGYTGQLFPTLLYPETMFNLLESFEDLNSTLMEQNSVCYFNF